MTGDLFDALESPRNERVGPGTCLLHGFARDSAATILAALPALLEQAPLRRMMTPGGQPMSVEMSQCGALGWVSDRDGYRYTRRDPLTGAGWPALPSLWRELA